MFGNEKIDQPSPAEFMDAIRKVEAENKKKLVRSVLVGALVGYALRKKS